MEIKIILDEQEEGGFTVSVPSLPGCISQGETVEESLRNIREAIDLHLDVADVGDADSKRKIVSINV